MLVPLLGMASSLPTSITNPLPTMPPTATIARPTASSEIQAMPSDRANHTRATSGKGVRVLNSSHILTLFVFIYILVFATAWGQSRDLGPPGREATGAIKPTSADRAHSRRRARAEPRRRCSIIAPATGSGG